MWPGKCPFSFKARHNEVSGRLLLSTAHLLFRRLGAAVCPKGSSRWLRSPAPGGPSAEPVCGRPERPVTGLCPTASRHAIRRPCSASSVDSALGLGRRGVVAATQTTVGIFEIKLAQGQHFWSDFEVPRESFQWF